MKAPRAPNIGLSFLTLLSIGNAQEGLLIPDTFPPTCDGCVCIPEDGESCPDITRQTAFERTEQLKKMTWTNPIHLECNPYPYAAEEGCGLTDGEGELIEEDLGPDSVCGILVNADDVRANKCYGSYSTKSFASHDEAVTAGYEVTHTGACGACSSLQDLAIYIDTPDLQGPGQTCGLRALSNETEGLMCYEDIGFSKYCAASWLYDTTNTRENCLDICLEFLRKPPNLDMENCPLNDCIHCNEAISGPYFKKYAGRTRRGSGLMSYIIRNCSELVTNISPLDPCPNGYTTGKEDESYPEGEEMVAATPESIFESSSSHTLTSMVFRVSALLAVVIIA